MNKNVVVGSVVLLLGAILLGLALWLIPQYNVYASEMAGKAEMVKAEQNRKIIIEEAKARLEAEKLNAEAEVERARGMKEAMDIENGSLTTTYNQYLFIRTLEKLSDKGNLPQIIYIPAEGLVPVMDIHK